MRSLPAIRMEMPCFWTGVGISYFALLMLLVRSGARREEQIIIKGCVLFSPVTL